MMHFMHSFSFYLRRTWNTSHFSLVPLAFFPAFYNSAVRAGNGELFGFILGLFCLLMTLRAITRADLHNRPAAVPEIFRFTIALPFICAIAVIVLMASLQGEMTPWAFVSSICNIIALLLITTPGMKVPYHPDNVSFNPV